MKKNNPTLAADPTQAYYTSELIARSLVRIGIPRYKSYQMAHEIWEEMGTKKKLQADVEKKILDVLKEKYPQKIETYKKWEKIMQKKKPLIVLLGGGTGIGTSTVALRLGWLLEINHLLGSDSIREVIRRFLPKEITPLLNVSTYQVADLVKRVHSHKDGLIYGFLSQSKKVLYAIEGILQRSIKEDMSVIIEGIHLVPGEMEFLKKYEKKATIIQIILDVDREKTHKQHILNRQIQNTHRRNAKYLEHFSDIRFIRKYIVQQAEKNNVPVVQNYMYHQAEKDILEVIYQHYFRTVKK